MVSNAVEKASKYADLRLRKALCLASVKGRGRRAIVLKANSIQTTNSNSVKQYLSDPYQFLSITKAKSFLEGFL
jgi:hypothetical protein